MNISQKQLIITDLTKKNRDSQDVKLLMETAKRINLLEIEKEFEKFKKTDLWKEIQSFNKEYDGIPIFKSSKKESNINGFMYNEKEIDPLSVSLLILFIKYWKEDNFFEDYNDLAIALQNKGEKEIGDYIMYKNWLYGNVPLILWNFYDQDD